MSCFVHFISDDSKQDSATNIIHRKFIIELLMQRNIVFNTLSKIWETHMVVLGTTDVPLHYT